MPQFTTSIDLYDFETLNVHFVYSKTELASPIPLLFLHGWPGSFVEVSKVLQPLNEVGFHVVAPSLPGFGFSSCPEKPGFKIENIATLMHTLMLRLGYSEYVVQGGDWGAMIAFTMAANHPRHVKAMHVNLLTTPRPAFEIEPVYTDFEKRSLAQHKHFDEHEFAYYQVQNTKPRTFGFALHDSPVGMLAWMADKLFTWSDSYPWSSIELITWTLLHYFPGPTTGFQIYRENSATEMIAGPNAKKFIEVPTGISAFGKEAEMVPQSWAKSRVNVVFWQEHESGGHFAAYEKPHELTVDLRRFYELVWQR